MSFFTKHWKIIVCGAFIGTMAAILQKFGNPANMGICVACFERDIAGALGFHQAAVVQYMRPEIIGLVLGSFIIAIFAKEYKPRAGSSTLIRFFLGVFAMIGALVFLGCPWRALLRLAGGDANAITGLAGLAAGIGIGVVFLRKGYSLGRSYTIKKSAGWVFPAFMLALLVMLIYGFRVSDTGPLFFSAKGPGSQHAPVAISIAAGMFIGILAQRSRFCTMGSFRDVIFAGDFHLIKGIGAFVVAALIMNLVYGQFHWGFQGQPVAHTNHLWNFMGMVLAGLAFTLAGGCPGRQLILSGEGDSDAAVFVIGMITGAGVCHNFLLASSPAGPGVFGPAAVVIGLVFCLIIGLVMREKIG